MEQPPSIPGLSEGVALPLEMNDDPRAAYALFPNPVRELLTVSYAGVSSSAQQIMLYNLSGQLMHMADAPAGGWSVEVDVADLPAGVYILRVKGEMGSYAFRVVVE